MSPILTRPIREQLEHDRIIRQLQVRYKRKHEVAINPGSEQNQSVMAGELAVYPDLLLYSLDRGRKLEGTVEVETGESVNQLEALAEWGVFSRFKAPFHLYVPPQSIESAKRICEEHGFPVAEIWTYHLSLDQVRFTQVYRSPNAPKPAPAPVSRPAPEPKAAPRPAAKTAKPAAKRAARPAAKAASSARTAKPARSATPAKPQKAKPVKASSAKAAKGAKPARAAKLARAAKPARAAKVPAAKRR